jgi:hypothetical protein
MGVTDPAVDTASAMGERAGELLTSSGIPTRNPFDRETRPELAQAWTAGYFDGQQPRRV